MFNIPTVKFDWTKNLKGEDRKLKLADQGSITGLPYYAFSLLVCSSVGVMSLARSTELIAMAGQSGIHGLMVVATWLFSASLLFSPPKTMGSLGKRYVCVRMYSMVFAAYNP